MATMPQADILEVENARFIAMTDGDLDTLDMLIADSALYIHSSGTIDTKHEYLTKLATGKFRYATVVAEDMRITGLGEAVALTYRMQARVFFPTGQHLIRAQATAIWRQYDDGIRLELFQSTPIPDEA